MQVVYITSEISNGSQEYPETDSPSVAGDSSYSQVFLAYFAFDQFMNLLSLSVSMFDIIVLS